MIDAKSILKIWICNFYKFRESFDDFPLRDIYRNIGDRICLIYVQNLKVFVVENKQSTEMWIPQC